MVNELLGIQYNIAKANRTDRKVQNLASYINVDTLRAIHKTMDKKKAYGIDKVTKEDYELNLEENLANLVKRMKSGSYCPNPTRRVYIPKETKGKMSASRKRFLSENPEYYQKNLENIMCAVEKAAELKRKTVIQYDLDGNFLAVWNSTREAERVLGIHHSHIAECCNKLPKHNTAGGYRWEYAD